MVLEPHTWLRESEGMTIFRRVYLMALTPMAGYPYVLRGCPTIAAWPRRPRCGMLLAEGPRLRKGEGCKG